MLKSADPVDEEDETCKGEGGNRLEKYVAEAEKRALREVIEKCGNNRTRAMRLLGLSRGTFYNKLKKYGLI
jgi:DNA-binding protein Fis